MGFFGQDALQEAHKAEAAARKPGGGGQAINFFESVANLSPKAKQAMYSAATHGLIKRRTWDGCAFNKAAEVVGHSNVNSPNIAAKVLDMPARRVSEFISHWDNLEGTDESCTKLLLRTLDEVGLFSEPAWMLAQQSPTEKVRRTVRTRVYTSYETKMREAFEASNASAPIEGAAEAGLLLSGVCPV